MCWRAGYRQRLEGKREGMREGMREEMREGMQEGLIGHQLQSFRVSMPKSSYTTMAFALAFKSIIIWCESREWKVIFYINLALYS